MASVKLSGLVSQIKGKLNGSYFQKTVGGTGLNNNGNSSQKKSKHQRYINADARIAQIGFGNLAAKWRQLSDANRAAWLAKCPDYPTVNRFGDPRNPSAYELYMRLNGVLRRYGLATIATPLAPTALTNIGAITLDVSGGTKWAVDPTTDCNSDEIICWFACPPVSQGRKFPYNKAQYLGQSATGETYPFDWYDEFINLYGNMPADSRYYGYAIVVNKTTGQASAINTFYSDY